MILTEYEWQTLLLSLKIAGAAILFSLPIGILTAWILARCQFLGKSLFDSIVHLPLVLPPVVLGYLLLITMGRHGFIGEWLSYYLQISFSFNWQGAALASAVVAFPLMVRSIRLAIESIDLRLECVARTLGANPLKVFITITLPLAFPGILMGIVLGFARCLGEFGATITFVSNIQGETRTLPLAMYTLLQMPNGEHAALRLCIISIVLSLAALFLSEMLNRWHKQKLFG
ncbi:MULTISPECIES: molybdate ABC transporter permease subunit [unclassified Gilliamella]|uniref:molybdate ABC transporter permease subunit n=1 Tax=unclassified Gilliamella TaxID=2685620 RepID=UPI00226AD1AF|nr:MULTISPECIES: molybdate ABC transporter permease subunit [unclassified Gilliamella]MCX8641166.1 molybdate ABC transporter permease subunit [Gilliamella sp. B3835]MCX8707075.1 molybdate ABC transporter permease subunit [Gilliamella sp. B3783]MCX8710428.1 molybdate ABC transporter permease subunit [Gilliamella sp. B3780]MCX8715110.1 molybdate ABC transporter permease subunit [Gilliamella sp. B3781]MCX8716058.1 molybdate ABC transporter permease subunit [Gilliamella sp. B3784]